MDVVGIFIIYAGFALISIVFFAYENFLRYFGIKNPWKCFYYRTKESVPTDDSAGIEIRKKRRNRSSFSNSSGSRLFDNDNIVGSDDDPCWALDDCYGVDLKDIKDGMKQMSIYVREVQNDVARLCLEVAKLQKVQKVEKEMAGDADALKRRESREPQRSIWRDSPYDTSTMSHEPVGTRSIASVRKDPTTIYSHESLSSLRPQLESSSSEKKFSLVESVRKALGWNFALL